jgi:hypothetical protein
MSNKKYDQEFDSNSFEKFKHKGGKNRKPHKKVKPRERARAAKYLD